MAYLDIASLLSKTRPAVKVRAKLLAHGLAAVGPALRQHLPAVGVGRLPGLAHPGRHLALVEELTRLEEVVDLTEVTDAQVVDAAVDVVGPQLVGVLEDLVDEGKLRAYGWSSDDAERVASWAGQRGCAGTEFELNVLDDAPDLVMLCESHELLGLVRGPLAMGLLGGRYRADTRVADGDVRGRHAPEWMRWFRDGRPTPDALARLDAIREVLTSEGRTLAQGALAWIWARSPALVPIPGARTVEQLRDNAGALEKGPLTPAQMRQVEQLSSPGVA